MRVLLDECLPRKLKNAFRMHECRTAPEAGFAGIKNGTLLRLAETAAFDVLLTMDKGLEYEQNLRGRRIAVVIIRAKSNRLADILPHVPACVAAIGSARAGELYRVG
jgi:predicted nuclease of predicted toxin-antitoxin system